VSNENAHSRTGESPQIVVGVDGSPSSAEALRWAVNQARLTGQMVQAVIAWEFPPFSGLPPLGEEVDWADVGRAILGKAVHSALAERDARGVNQHVARGGPAQVLLDAARGADLLVVGCRGYGGFSGLLLGSVSQHVVTHAACPVVVVRAHGDRP
jgi:nucleotide-binding universal stress UspA family protein